MRGRRIGTNLMAEAECLARSRGCHAAWLDTSSTDAERFYLRLGYESFGVLENTRGEQPQGHRRSFLSKRLR
jgi:GNAT superfamily N-acetyltransferase